MKKRSRFPFYVTVAILVFFYLPIIIVFMQSFMENFRVESTRGRGTTVIMSKSTGNNMVRASEAT